MYGEWLITFANHRRPQVFPEQEPFLEHDNIWGGSICSNLDHSLLLPQSPCNPTILDDMGLLSEIQDAAVDGTFDLETLLRKCRVLATKLKHEELKNWVACELDGYPSDIPLPGYRKCSGYAIFRRGDDTEVNPTRNRSGISGGRFGQVGSGSRRFGGRGHQRHGCNQTDCESLLPGIIGICLNTLV